MVQVNIDNDHVSTAISGDEFFITPEVVKPTKWRKSVKETPVNDQDSIKSLLNPSGDYIYIVVANPGQVIKYSTSDGSEIWRTDIDAEISTSIRSTLYHSSDKIITSSAEELLSIDESTGNIDWVTESVSSVNAIVEVSEGIFTGNKLIDPANGNELNSNSDNNYSNLISVNGNAYGIIRLSNGEQVAKEITTSNDSDFGNTGWSVGLVNIRDDRSNLSRFSAISLTPNDNIIFSYKEGYFTPGGQRVASGSKVVDPTDGTVVGTAGVAVSNAQFDENGSVYGFQVGGKTGNSLSFKKWTDLSFDSVEYSLSVDHFSLLSTDNLVIGDPTNSDIYRRDTADPSVEDATYKLNISGTGALKLDGIVVIPSGTTKTLESYIDSGVLIEGDCFISGVRVK